MRKEKDIKILVKEMLDEIKVKPNYLIQAENKNSFNTMVKVKGKKTDLLFGLSMIIEFFIEQGVATEKDIRRVVDMCFKKDEELKNEVIDKLKELENHLDNVIKKL